MRPRGVLSAWLSHRFQYEGRTMGILFGYYLYSSSQTVPAPLRQSIPQRRAKAKLRNSPSDGSSCGLRFNYPFHVIFR